mgnify:CR=1 FL=1
MTNRAISWHIIPILPVRRESGCRCRCIQDRLGRPVCRYCGHDLMWAKVENKASDELLSSGLSTTFHHQLALLYVNIGNEDVKVENVKVNGLNTTAHFDLLKGELSVDDAPKAVTLHKIV